MKIGKFGHRGEWSSPDTLDRTIYPEDEEVSLWHHDSIPAAVCQMEWCCHAGLLPQMLVRPSPE